MGAATAYDEALGEWRAAAAEVDDCATPFANLYGGDCSAEVVFLAYLPDGGSVNFYDRDSGVVLGQLHISDTYESACGFYTYWGGRVDCTNGVVTEVMCGAVVKVGDAVSFEPPTVRMWMP